MDLKLVLCDIDGTLTHSDRTMGQNNIDAINALLNHGVMFGVASGRKAMELREFVERWHLVRRPQVIIGMNGSEIWHEDSQTLYDYYQLSCEQLKEIIGFMEPLQLNPFMYKGNIMFCKEKDDWMAFSSKRNGKGIVTANSMEEFYDEPNAKVMFRVPEDKMNKYLEYSLKQCEGKTYTAFRTQPTLIEFEDRRANKGFGLCKVCELLDIKPENVMAFGDTSNDNEMLKEAGYAVCMCNGTDDTKALADDITDIDHNHDGFADYVNKRILKPNGWM